MRPTPVQRAPGQKRPRGYMRKGDRTEAWEERSHQATGRAISCPSQRVTAPAAAEPTRKGPGTTVPYLKWLRLALSSVAYWHWDRPGVADPDGGGCYGRPAELGGMALGTSPERQAENCGLMASGYRCTKLLETTRAAEAPAEAARRDLLLGRPSLAPPRGVVRGERRPGELRGVKRMP